MIKSCYFSVENENKRQQLQSAHLIKKMVHCMHRAWKFLNLYTFCVFVRNVSLWYSVINIISLLCLLFWLILNFWGKLEKWFKSFSRLEYQKRWDLTQSKLFWKQQSNVNIFKNEKIQLQGAAGKCLFF